MRQIIQGNQIRHQGRTLFHFKTIGLKLGRLEVSEKVAWMLRCGEAAIAGYVEKQREVYVVISAKAARRIADIDSKAIVFLRRIRRAYRQLTKPFLNQRGRRRYAHIA